MSSRTRSAVVALATALVLPFAVAPSAQAAVADGTRSASYERSVIAQISSARAKQGLPSLLELPGLRSAARGWSAHLAARSSGVARSERLVHQDLATIRTDTRAAGCTGGYAEIVLWATPAPSAAKVVRTYLGSSGHRSIVLSSKYTHVGSGTVVRDGITYNTIRFASRCARTTTKVSGWATKRSLTVGRTQKDTVKVAAVAPRKVVLQKRVGGRWTKVRTYTTSRTGRLVVTIPASSKAGKVSYRLRAARTTTHKAAVSKVKVVTYAR